MITLHNVHKTYKSKQKEHAAVIDASLTIKANTIHGIIGPSGAGKSTLIRLINKLETIDLGSIHVLDYGDIKKLNKESTRMLRRDVSMIFQHFNVLDQKTVFDNIALPITLHRSLTELDRKEINDLIDLVGLTGNAHSYPSQLSGGQLQRIGIARALINKPKILLCDEPTSALDPLTIKTILNLLKEIQQKRGLTVVIVTHDMNVINEICDYVTVMENGRVVEQNSLENIIFESTYPLTKQLLGTIGYDLSEIKSQYNTQQLLILKFDIEEAKSSILSEVAKESKININIIYAKVQHNQKGIMVIHIESDKAQDLITIQNLLLHKGVEVKHV
jgi:D-methionine transport system ATP-binding protein